MLLKSKETQRHTELNTYKNKMDFTCNQKVLDSLKMETVIQRWTRLPFSKQSCGSSLTRVDDGGQERGVLSAEEAVSVED